LGGRNGALHYELAQVCRKTHCAALSCCAYGEDTTGYDAAPAYCLITDISDGGVRIYLNGLEVPDEFVLLLEGDGPAMDGRYRVVWREGDEVGAKYVR
jgi:PilZ domain